MTENIEWWRAYKDNKLVAQEENAHDLVDKIQYLKNVVICAPNLEPTFKRAGQLTE